MKQRKTHRLISPGWTAEGRPSAKRIAFFQQEGSIIHLPSFKGALIATNIHYGSCLSSSRCQKDLWDWHKTIIFYRWTQNGFRSDYRIFLAFYDCSRKMRTMISGSESSVGNDTQTPTRVLRTWTAINTHYIGRRHLTGGTLSQEIEFMKTNCVDIQRRILSKYIAEADVDTHS